MAEAPEPAAPEADARVVEITDERDPLTERALELIAESFASHERQPLSELRSEVEEKRRALLLPYDFHMYAAVTATDSVLAMVSGVYLAGINAGFVTYLAVREEARRRGLGGRVRAALVDALREDSRRAGRADLAFVLGEVRADGDWLDTLVRQRDVLVFDLTYYHPGMVLGGAPPYALYREPIADERRELPADEVRRVLYSVWRRGYRVRYPLERATFQAMLEELETREVVGVHPDHA